MDWAKVIGLAADVHTAFTVAGIRNAQEAELTSQRQIDEARSVLFNMRQTAETTMSTYGVPQKLVAAAMRIIETELIDSGITPNRFREFADKEYALAAIKYIREQTVTALSPLSYEEKAEIDEIVIILNRLPEYDAYLSQYDAQLHLMRAQETVDLYKNRNGCIPVILIGIVMFIMWLYSWILMANGSSGNGFVSLIFIIVVGFGVYQYNKWAHLSEYHNAKNTVNSLRFVQLSSFEFARLHKKFGSDTQARTLQAADKERIRTFFGDSNLLTN
jgi:hypothetical protein